MLMLFHLVIGLLAITGLISSKLFLVLLIGSTLTSFISAITKENNE